VNPLKTAPGALPMARTPVTKAPGVATITLPKMKPFLYMITWQLVEYI